MLPKEEKPFSEESFPEGAVHEPFALKKQSEKAKPVYSSRSASEHVTKDVEVAGPGTGSDPANQECGQLALTMGALIQKGKESHVFVLGSAALAPLQVSFRLHKKGIYRVEGKVPLRLHPYTFLGRWGGASPRVEGGENPS